MATDKSQKPKSIVFQWITLAAVTAVLLELGLLSLGQRYETYFRLPPVSSKNFRVDARRFLKSERFDKDLGWDEIPPIRNYVEGKQFFAQAYGDSFTLASDADTSWQETFEELTGEAILNFGVGGYGLDQAILKYEKYGTKYSTGVAILGLYPETYRRARSYYSRYYFSNYEKWKFIFKPFFALENNRYKLFEPPCSDEQCLWDANFDPKSNVRRVMIEHDYWFQHDLSKPKLEFPRTLNYLRALPVIWNRRKQAEGKADSYFVSQESFELTKFLVRRFAQHAEDNGMIPVFLLLYSSHDLRAIKRGQRWDAMLLKFLERNDLRYVDTAAFIIKRHTESDEFMSLRLRDRHLNAKGNRLVAAALSEQLARMELIKKSVKPIAE